MIVGALVAVLLWIGCVRARQRPPGGRTPPAPAVIRLPPVGADGVWEARVCPIWVGGRAAGPGDLRCTTDGLQWCGRTATVWLDWTTVLAVAVAPRGHAVWIHSTAVPPLLIPFPDPWAACAAITAAAGL